MNIDLIILAGGFSKRMGVLKPLLPVGNLSAALRCIRMGKEAGVREIIVVTGFMHSEVERAITESIINEENNALFEAEVGSKVSETEVRFAYNKDYAEGMFSSVVTGVNALRDGATGFFLLPVDCCAVSSDTLRKLASVFADNAKCEKSTKNAESEKCATCVKNPDNPDDSDNAENCLDAVIRPRYKERRGHPPLIPTKYADTLTAYSGEEGLKAVLRTLPTIEVEMDSEETLLDMDTPQDYAQLLMFLGFPTYPTAEQCAQLLAEYGATQQIIEHGEEVAELACRLASFINDKRAGIDISLLRSACLLHDICRAEREHERVGMELMLKCGYPKIAVLIGEHMELRAHVEHVRERELLYLADKLCRNGRIVAIDETIKELTERFASNPEARENAIKRMQTAAVILDMIKAQYGDPNGFMLP